MTSAVVYSRFNEHFSGEIHQHLHLDETLYPLLLSISMGDLFGSDL